MVVQLVESINNGNHREREREREREVGWWLVGGLYSEQERRALVRLCCETRKTVSWGGGWNDRIEAFTPIPKNDKEE